jgi:hypothetical protein
MTANECNTNECMVHQIVTQDLNIEVCAKMVPKNVHNQKAGQNEVSAEMLERHSSNTSND